MSKIKDDNYYQISGWMLNRLGLKGVELQIFAIIYGFSQDGESMFSGSLSYLGDWVGASRPTVIKALKELVAKQYVTKESFTVSNVTFNKYGVNMQTVENLRGSKETLQGSKETLHNNNQYNNTNILSKDSILDTADTQPQASAKPSSGKLFSSAKPTTRKTSVEKTNNFITDCERQAVKKEFSAEVLAELSKYFRMLAEMNCLLPSVSIAEQLVQLKAVPEGRQVTVVKNTISRGWKSLQYEAQSAVAPGSYNKSGFVDTASPNTFTATPEEDKNGDWKSEIPEDHIF